MKQTNKSYLPLIAIFGCCLIWGTTFTVVKNASDALDPFLLSGLRNTIACLSMLLFFVVSRKTKILQDKKAMISGSIIGLMLGAIYISQTIGISLTTANHSAFITCSAVVIVPILLFLLGWQSFSLLQVISIVIVGVGLTLLTLKSGLSGFHTGDLITFLAAIICALHIVFSGKYVRKYNFLALIFYQFVFAALLSYAGLFTKQAITGFQTILLETDAWFSILYLGFLGTLFCYFVTVWGQKHVSTVYIALIFSLEPLFASVTNFVVLEETFTLKELTGGFVIFIGIIIYSLTQKKQKILK